VKQSLLTVCPMAETVLTVVPINSFPKLLQSAASLADFFFCFFYGQA